VEVTGGDEAIAAVVARAGEDEDAAFGPCPAQTMEGGVSHGPAGVFHQDEDGDVIFLDGAAIEFPQTRP
jgi:hypothetical protein